MRTARDTLLDTYRQSLPFEEIDLPQGLASMAAMFWSIGYCALEADRSAIQAADMRAMLTR